MTFMLYTDNNITRTRGFKRFFLFRFIDLQAWTLHKRANGIERFDLVPVPVYVVHIQNASVRHNDTLLPPVFKYRYFDLLPKYQGPWYQYNDQEME